MFTYLFYFFGFIAIFFELWIMKEENYLKTRELFKKVSNKDVEHKNLKLSKEESSLFLLLFWYMVWNLVGLFSSQWILFLILIILAWINNAFKKFYTWNLIDSLLSVILIAFIIINKFHLHINLWQEIKNFYN